MLFRFPSIKLNFYFIAFLLIATSCLFTPAVGAGELTVGQQAQQEQVPALVTTASLATAPPTPPPTKEEVLLAAAQMELPDVEFLAIDDKVKALLDQHVRPARDKARRAEKLHDFLFTEEGLDIQYDADFTRTAQETFDLRSGNCVSHAALYIASARYLHMKARFQNVEVPRSWEKEDDFYIVPGHVNAAIKLPFGRRAVAEFISTYYYDFNKAHYKEEIIPDRRALADYYNNLGMEAMRGRDYAKSIAYLNKSIELVSRNDAVWSNLGVVYKFIGAHDLAEDAYSKALDINKHNISTIKNLYILYHQTGRATEAQQFAKRVERDNRKNPYFLARMAETDIELGKYDSAISNITRAIKIDPEEETFYVTLATIHAATGNINGSIEAMKKAAEFAKNVVNDYPKKLEMLQALK